MNHSNLWMFVILVTAMLFMAVVFLTDGIQTNAERITTIENVIREMQF